MAISDDLRQIRIDKLEDLKKNGFAVYPIDCKRTHQIGDALLDFEKLAADLIKITLDGCLESLRFGQVTIFFFTPLTVKMHLRVWLFGYGRV